MFISNAYAQVPGLSGSPVAELTSFLPIIVMFALLYFMMIRPQMKRQKEVQNMLANLKKGDEVVAAGLLGRIQAIDDAYLELEIARNTVVKVQRQAVTALLPNGTLK
ncbi:MAG: preprotein translocase subunit YajC [Pseudomonadota bacterium]|nr:preprotein translocase subunit YajC [Pseudomonadota bacterium]